MRAIQAILLAAGLTLWPFYPARADLRIDFYAEINELVAAGDLATAETRLIDEFLASTADEPDDRIALLDTLAEVQARAGRFADLGDTLWNKAGLMARDRGPDAPELAPVYEAAGDAYLDGDVPDRAVRAFAAALRLDQRYLGCDGAALAALHARRAEALDRAGDAEAAAEARRLATDPDARCAAARGSRSVAEAAPDPDGPFATVEIFYGTDRQPSGSDRPNAFYGWQRSPRIDYGRALVTIPRVHQPGRLEAPSLLSFKWEENPDRHIVLADLQELPEAEFYRWVGARLEERGSDESFIFIHGFNMSFAKGAKRTAQLTYDMNFAGVPILYSWPSRGNAGSYMADSATVQVSARRLRGFLQDVVAQSGASRVHILAHSMGNRALLEALELMAPGHADAPLFDQIIFAAPDVDAELFALQAAAVAPLARRMTLYTSSTDVALSTSRALHGDAPRAGQGGEQPLVAAGFDTVDMTEIGRDLLEHSYFASEPSALTDILWMFWKNPPPPGRCGMAEEAIEPGVYWVYVPELCDGSLLLRAITLARRFGAAAVAQVDAMIEGAVEGETEELRDLRAAVAGLVAE